MMQYGMHIHSFIDTKMHIFSPVGAGRILDIMQYGMHILEKRDADPLTRGEEGDLTHTECTVWLIHYGRDT